MPTTVPYTFINGVLSDAPQVNANFTALASAIDALTPQTIDDLSSTLTAMQATASPGTVGAESLPNTLEGEVQRLRYVLKAVTGGLQWYALPTIDLANVHGLVGDHISGLTLRNNLSVPAAYLDIAAGECNSDDVVATSRFPIVLLSPLTKLLESLWVAGNVQGGRDFGTIQDGTYHVYVIKRVDTGAVDVLFSLNPHKSGPCSMTITSPGVVTLVDHGLQIGSTVVFSTTGALPTGLVAGTRYYVTTANFTKDTFSVSETQGGTGVNLTGSQSGVHTATSDPVMPTSYTLKRRIGSIIRTSAEIKKFWQDGPYFFWDVPMLDLDINNPGTATATRTLTTPVGIRAVAMVTASVGGYNADTTPSAILVNDLLGSTTQAQNAWTAYQPAKGAYTGAGYAMVRTNYAAQIRSINSASDEPTSIGIQTWGYIDRRGF